MSNLKLFESLSRIQFPCEVSNGKAGFESIEQTVLFDTGSPNSMVTENLVKRLGLKPINNKRYRVKVSGVEISLTPSVVIPMISFGEMVLKDVRVLVGLPDAEWQNTFLLGLNVLNFFAYKIDRSIGHGYIDITEGTRIAPKGTKRSRLNHLIMNGRFDIAPD